MHYLPHYELRINGDEYLNIQTTFNILQYAIFQDGLITNHGP